MCLKNTFGVRQSFKSFCALEILNLMSKIPLADSTINKLSSTMTKISQIKNGFEGVHIFAGTRG